MDALVVLLMIIGSGYIVVYIYAPIFVYGKPLSNKEIEVTLNNIQPLFKGVNYLDNKTRMIYCPQSKLSVETSIADISGFKIPFRKLYLFRWIINDVGIVPVWSKYNAEIEQLYESLPTMEEAQSILDEELERRSNGRVQSS